MLIGTNK